MMMEEIDIAVTIQIFLNDLNPIIYPPIIKTPPRVMIASGLVISSKILKFFSVASAAITSAYIDKLSPNKIKIILESFCNMEFD